MLQKLVYNLIKNRSLEQLEENETKYRNNRPQQYDRYNKHLLNFKQENILVLDIGHGNILVVDKSNILKRYKLEFIKDKSGNDEVIKELKEDYINCIGF